MSKVWEDENDKYGKRPKSVRIQVKVGEEIIEEVKVNEETDWSNEFKLPKYDSLGNEIEYTIDEEETPKYYEKRIEGNVVINKCIYEPAVDTSDINIWIYVVISLVAVIGVVVGIVIVKNNKNSKV